jgi:hypothetical protein
MRGAISPVPQYTSMAWYSVKNTGTTSSFNVNYMRDLSTYSKLFFFFFFFFFFLDGSTVQCGPSPP